MTARRRTGTADVLTDRQLGRATLARQLLLERAAVGVPAAIEQVLGLNAQVADPPYLSLWSRVAGFRLDDLTACLLDRTVVRSPAARCTQRLVTATDLCWLRPALAPMLAQAQRGTFGRQLVGLDLAELTAYAEALLAERPRTGAELRTALAERFPGYDRSALAYSAQYLVATVGAPEVAMWGSRSRVTHVLAEQWIGRRLDAAPGVAELVRRYLAAFGPATAADLRSWSRVAGLGPAFDDLRPSLRTFRDERGRELFDLPEAPRPDADTPAPVRLLPLFDELLLGHADRRRIMTDDVRRAVCVPDVIKPSVLVDGLVCGTWTLERREGSAVLEIQPLPGWRTVDEEEVVAEAARLAAFACPDATDRDIRVLSPTGG